MYYVGNVILGHGYTYCSHKQQLFYLVHFVDLYIILPLRLSPYEQWWRSEEELPGGFSLPG